jgi:RimJ/RimL family protein N-acetyltransferase
MDFPHFLTKRLCVRPRTAADLPDLLRLHHNPMVMRYARSSDRVAWDQKLCRSLERPFPCGLGYWTLQGNHAAQRFIGSAMLIPIPEDPTALEAGWRLEPAAWGCGYAQEALDVILTHGFSLPTVARIVAYIHEGNLASIKLAGRLGFAPADVLSGTHRLFETFAASALRLACPLSLDVTIEGNRGNDYQTDNNLLDVG